ncbi:MAG: hypothetical protein ACJ71L_10595 [Nitrososphaeraceae archaeon]
MKKSSLVFLSLSMIIASAVLSMNVANYSAIPSAYGQTNAAMIATLVASNNSNGNVIMNNAIASSAITNSTTTTTPTATSNTTEGLQIKKGINYFDSASGYLVYPSIANNNNNAAANTASSSKKLPAVIMIGKHTGKGGLCGISS